MCEPLKSYLESTYRFFVCKSINDLVPGIDEPLLRVILGIRIEWDVLWLLRHCIGLPRGDLTTGCMKFGECLLMFGQFCTDLICHVPDCPGRMISVDIDHSVLCLAQISLLKPSEVSVLRRIYSSKVHDQHELL